MSNATLTDDELAAAATSAAQTEKFCSTIGNVVTAPTSATAASFDQFKADAIASATQSASPTRSTDAAERLVVAGRGAWE